jgi:hypothetical protein
MTPQAKKLLEKIERDIAIELPRDRRNQAMIDAMKCVETGPAYVASEECREIIELFDQACLKADRLDEEGKTDEAHDAYMESLVGAIQFSYRKFAQIVPTTMGDLLTQITFEREMRKSNTSSMLDEEAPPAFDIAAVSLMAKRAA